MGFYEKHRHFVEDLQRTAPEGVRIEWSGDTLIIQAAPSSIHQRNVGLVQRQFEQHAPAGYLFGNDSAVASSDMAMARVPDLSCLAADEAVIAVEVVSKSNPGNDRMDKLRDYAVMRIPLYLIIDPRQQTVTLFSEPNHDEYHTRSDRKFGDRIRIPEPFGFELELDTLVPYGD
ncbi:Uma2 family endonuclease [Kitasatospora sp. NBC_01250]|uniref:Uma2 family endonuclease n=1 Tax=Kitasatospora sp. NBC_01250 TaxID=2903571 RepID=UPI002E327E80|nr:Uma2 family endonuclease [Kitasatospora sp. NBC_01250]